MKRATGGRLVNAKQSAARTAKRLEEKQVEEERDARLAEEDLDDEANMAPPVEKRMVPNDQIKGLSEKQLQESWTKSLTAANPNVSKVVTRFNYKDNVFRLDEGLDHMAVHFCMESVLISAHPESDDQREQAPFLPAAPASEKRNAGTSYDFSALGVSVGTDSKSAGTGPSAEETAEAEREAAALLGGRVLRNQFNFSERATQTFNNPMRDRKVATEPPPRSNFSANVTHWELYDTYMEDFDRQMLSKNSKERKGKFGEAVDDKEDASAAASTVAVADPTKTERFAQGVRIMERLVNQNAEDITFWKYKYADDKNEWSRPDGKGSFIDLWKFSYSKAKRKTVTSIVWNKEFTDLFAVGFGSYDFTQQTSGGVICCYTIKNTSFPEYTFTTESGVMSLDFHPSHSSLLVCGLYNGTVCVFDIRTKKNEPIYISSDPKVKHKDPVWQVYWNKEEPGKPINFFSVSSDGRVTNWVMNKNDLINEEVVELKLTTTPARKEKEAEELKADAPKQEEETAVVGLAGGCCFDFNKFQPHLFVVGTEEGAIQLYSKAYNSQLVRNFEGHHMAVYAVRWNTFHPNIFLSCSADWTVKLWEANTSTAIMTFDLNTSVTDVQWAPYSSTVFCTVTNDGRLRVYDLAVNKHEPIGERQLYDVVAKPKQPGDKPKQTPKKLSHVCFNHVEPIICVGDDKGSISMFKLTSNLRKMSAPKLEDIDQQVEINRLDEKLIIPERAAHSLAALAAAGGDRPTLGLLGLMTMPILPSGMGLTGELKVSASGTTVGGAANGSAGGITGSSPAPGGTLALPGGNMTSPSKSPRRAQ